MRNENQKNSVPNSALNTPHLKQVTLAEAINRAANIFSAAGITNDRRDAEVLLSQVIKRDRAWLITRKEEVLDSTDQRIFDDLVRRRANREPLQYIIGNQEFWGLEFKVTPDTLIPRPESELIIDATLGIMQDRNRAVRIIDLCTGTGCLAVSLAKELTSAYIIATDTSEKALAVARENARGHDVAGRIRFFTGDLFEPLEELDIRGQLDIIVSNPPYVRAGDLPALQREVKDYEPAMALVAGPEGTGIHQRIISSAHLFLQKNGTLIMEMGMGQAEALTRMVKAEGVYDTIEIQKDLAGIERVIIAKKK
jgi:release factor glutamine methyltransferase